MLNKRSCLAAPKCLTKSITSNAKAILLITEVDKVRTKLARFKDQKIYLDILKYSNFARFLQRRRQIFKQDNSVTKYYISSHAISHTLLCYSNPT